MCEVVFVSQGKSGDDGMFLCSQTDGRIMPDHAVTKSQGADFQDFPEWQMCIHLLFQWFWCKQEILSGKNDSADSLAMLPWSIVKGHRVVGILRGGYGSIEQEGVTCCKRCRQTVGWQGQADVAVGVAPQLSFTVFNQLYVAGYGLSPELRRWDDDALVKVWCITPMCYSCVVTLQTKCSPQ